MESSARRTNFRLNTLVFKVVGLGLAQAQYASQPAKEKISYMKKASKAKKFTRRKKIKAKIAYLQIKAKLSYQLRCAFKRPTGFNLFKFKISKKNLSTSFLSTRSILEILQSRALNYALDIKKVDLKPFIPNGTFGLTKPVSAAVPYIGNSQKRQAEKVRPKKERDRVEL